MTKGDSVTAHCVTAHSLELFILIPFHLKS